MILFLLWLAQTPTYSNRAPTGEPIHLQKVQPPPPPVKLPPEELAGLYAHQYIYLPPEWLMGPTSVTIAADANWPLPKQTIPNRWYENRWDLSPVIHYHPPLYGPRYATPIALPSRPFIHGDGTFRRDK